LLSLIRPVGGIFDELRTGPKPVGAIAAKLPVSRPAVSQHLKVLREARLVSERPEGTRRVYFIDLYGLGELRAWLDRLWDQSLVAFQAEVERQGASKQRERK
jgi:DNA-binding transcriptional ArsR family regulator